MNSSAQSCFRLSAGVGTAPHERRAGVGGPVRLLTSTGLPGLGFRVVEAVHHDEVPRPAVAQVLEPGAEGSAAGGDANACHHLVLESNWRGEPLRDYETIVKLIARTTTATGLKVICRVDRRKYATGRASDAEMKTLRLERDRFHGDWNYVTGRVVSPHS